MLRRAEAFRFDAYQCSIDLAQIVSGQSEIRRTVIFFEAVQFSRGDSITRR